MPIPLADTFGFTPNKPNIDKRYLASNGQPYASVAAAETALASRLVATCVGLTVLVADENDPDYPKAKEYWVQPKGTTPETYGLVVKGAGVTDYAELENKPTINNVPLSGNKTATDLELATAEQGGKADTAIQGVSVNGTEVTPNPTTKKVALVIENGKSAYQLYLDNYEDEHGSTDGALDEAAWLESLQGKSALQIYNETMNTSLDEAGFINVLKQNYPMEYVGYNQTAAGQSIGTAFAAIDQLPASASTAGKLYLMPNDETTPTGTELFITVQTDATTYMWYRLGALSVPSNVLTEDKIVNDLTTGGADKVPSAEAVKGLNEQLYGEDDNVEESDDYATIFDNDTSSPFKYTSAASLTQQDPVYDGSPASGSKRTNFIPPKEFCFKVKGKYTHLRITGPGTYSAFVLFTKKVLPAEDLTTQNLIDGGYLCDGYKTPVPVINISKNSTQTIPIPEDAITVYISHTSSDAKNRKPTSVVFFKTPHVDGDFDRLEKNTTELSGNFESITEIDETVVDFNSSVTQQTSLGPDDVVYFPDSSTAKLYKIFVEGYKEVKIKRGSRNCYLALCKNELPQNIGSVTVGTPLEKPWNYVDVTCEGYEINSTSAFRMIIDTDDVVFIKIKEGIKYLYIQKHFNDSTADFTPEYVKLYKLALKTKRDIIISDGLNLMRGSLLGGNIVDDSYRLVSNLIPLSAGFVLETKDGYNVSQCALYNAQGECLNPNFWASTQNYRFIKGWSTNKQLCNYYVRVVIGARNNPESTVVPLDVVDKFGVVADARLKQEIPNGFPMQQCNDRKELLANAMFKTIEKMPRARNSFYSKDTTFVGIPYSEVSEYDKFVGNHVSLKTFLTAIRNKRSVLYTERIRDNNATTDPGTTKYGFSYHGELTAQGTFYGTMCSGLASYLIDREDILLADAWDDVYGEYIYAKNGVTDYITVKQGNGFVTTDIDTLWKMIEPLDLCWSNGHIGVVTNVYKDVYGRIQLIEITEASSWQVYSTPYTKAQFMSRIYYEREIATSNWALIRIPNWANTSMSSPSDDDMALTQRFMDCSTKDVVVDPDISTFAGEYAAFAINSDEDNSESYNNYKAFLNIHRGGGYDRLQIFAETDDEATATPVVVVDISTNDGTFIYNSDIYPEDASSEEDWIVVDLMQLQTPLAHGKYKARVVSSSDAVVASGFSHFEMVDVSLSYNNTTKIVSFASNEGTPYLVRREDSIGKAMVADYAHELTPEEVNSGEYQIDWIFNSSNNYIKIFVRSDYGVVVKRIIVA